jgi:SAM-dependent methyltransferase
VGRPFVIGDVQRLPFATASFDFVICAHVLEHVEDPTAAVAELTRVGRRGYIETPSAEWERVAGFPFHRWMVSERDGRLVFRRKHRPIHDPDMARWFDNLQHELRLRGYIWWRRRNAGVYTSLIWDGAIPVEVHDQDAEDDQFVRATVLEEAATMPFSQEPLSRFDSLLERYGRFVRRRSQPNWSQVEELLRCPRCRGTLARELDQLKCACCATGYRVDADKTAWLLVD